MEQIRDDLETKEGAAAKTTEGTTAAKTSVVFRRNSYLIIYILRYILDTPS